jgi:hypothetical protein
MGVAHRLLPYAVSLKVASRKADLVDRVVAVGMGQLRSGKRGNMMRTVDCPLYTLRISRDCSIRGDVHTVKASRSSHRKLGEWRIGVRRRYSKLPTSSRSLRDLRRK